MNVDLEKLPPDAVAAIVAAKQEQALPSADIKDLVNSTKVEDVQQWVKIFGDGFKSFCHTLNVETNNFIKTPAGIVIASVIALKYGGSDMLHGISRTVLSTAFVLLFIVLWLYSYRKCHVEYIPKRFGLWQSKTEETKNSSTTIEPIFISSDGKAASVLIHSAVLVIVLIVYVCNI